MKEKERKNMEGGGEWERKIFRKLNIYFLQVYVYL